MRFLSVIVFILWLSLAVAKPSHNPDDYYDYSDYSNNVSDYSNNLDNSDEDSDDYSGGHSWVRDKTKLWENGTIPYIFQEDTESLNLTEKEIVRHAMNIIESQLAPGCIKFTEDKAGCQDCLTINKARKNGIKDCFTIIGRLKRKPTLTLGNSDCFKDNGRTVLHELGHSLGMVHEQNRSDRDKYIEVKKDLMFFRAQKSWIIKDRKFGETYKTVYDLFSFMHYPANQGCRDNAICVSIKQPYLSMFTSNGKKPLEKYPERLSPVDRYEISCAYSCPVFPKVLEEYQHYSNQIHSAVKYTVFGEECLDECEKRGHQYFWCHNKNSEIELSSPDGNSDYCSISPNTTIDGKVCQDECLQRDKEYYWCHIEEGGWGYCSPELIEPEIYPLVMIDDLPEQCSEYTILDEPERSVNNKNGRCRDKKGNWICYYDDFGEEGYADASPQWKGAGYYRLMQPAGTLLPEYAPGDFSCGTQHTGWLKGKHPEDSGSEVNMTACMDYDRGDRYDCKYHFDIKVTNCKGYYVYFLPDITNNGYARYCGTIPN